MPKFTFQLDVRDPPEKVVGAMLQLTGGAPIKQSFRRVYGKSAR